MIFGDASSFLEAVQSLKVKQKLPTNLSSEDLAKLSVELRERALFSAKTENAYYLQKIDDVLSAIIDAKLDLATARLRLKEALIQISYEPEPDKRGSIQDLSSDIRLNLVLQTNVEMAQGYGQWVQGQDPTILDEFPAQEFTRIESRVAERHDWTRRWAAAGGEFFTGRMIALKNSSVWTKLSRFGLPYSPFDFNSGMGVIDVDREEVVSLGLLSENQTLQPQSRGFNDNLKASAEVFSKGLKEALKQDPKLKIKDGVLKLKNRHRLVSLDLKEALCP